MRRIITSFLIDHSSDGAPVAISIIEHPKRLDRYELVVTYQGAFAHHKAYAYCTLDGAITAWGSFLRTFAAPTEQEEE